MNKSFIKSIFLYSLLLCVCFLAHVYFGAVKINFGELTDVDKLVLNSRLERGILAAVVGASLALSGSVLQRLLRNPLADPFILGISSGGAVFAATGTVIGIPYFLFGVPSQSMLAFAGCLFTYFLINFAKKKFPSADDYFSLPVVGLILNAFYASFLMLLVSVSSQTQLAQIHRWILGDLQNVGRQELLLVVVLSLALWVSLISQRVAINALSFGDELANTIGFSSSHIRRISLVLVSLLIGICVSVAGTVGFVGLIIPHISHRIHHKNYPLEWWGSLFLGASILLIADTFSRTLFAPAEIPVGVFTALFGAPVLLYLLFKKPEVSSK